MGHADDRAGPDPARSGRRGARKLTQLATALDVADALIVASAGSGVNKRTRVLGSLSSAVLAAGFGYLLGSSKG